MSVHLSPKHEVNPSVLHCKCCGKAYGIAMLGRLKEDVKASKDIYNGLCDDCKSVICQGGVLIIETRDGESGDNPYRTGRVIGISKEYKERNKIESPMVYMEHTFFEKFFGKTFSDNSKTTNNNTDK